MLMGQLYVSNVPDFLYPYRVPYLLTEKSYSPLTKGTGHTERTPALPGHPA